MLRDTSAHGRSPCCSSGSHNTKGSVNISSENETTLPHNHDSREGPHPIRDATGDARQADARPRPLANSGSEKRRAEQYGAHICAVSPLRQYACIGATGALGDRRSAIIQLPWLSCFRLVVLRAVLRFGCITHHLAHFHTATAGPKKKVSWLVVARTRCLTTTMLLIFSSRHCRARAPASCRSPSPWLPRRTGRSR